MTEEKAIEILKNNFPKTCKMVDGNLIGGFDDTDGDFGKAILLSMVALEEIQKYRSLGKVEFLADMKNHYTEVLSDLRQYQKIGTLEEIKDILNIISEGQDDVDEDGISTGLLHTLLEYAEYKKIGTVKKCEAYKAIAEKHFSKACIDMKIIDELEETNEF